MARGSRGSRPAQVEAQRRYRIASGHATGPELRRVATSQLEIALEALDGQAPSSDAVHEARKALKRVRALLRVSRHRLGDEVFRRSNRSLRDAGRALSGMRDAQMLGETVDSLAAQADGMLPAGALHRLRDAVEPETAPDSVVDLAAARQAISDTKARVPEWPRSHAGKPCALALGMKRIYRQGRRALKGVEKNPGDERWHELRKRSKDLWHAAQLLEESHPKRMRKLAERAHRLSELLGDDHDLAVLRERIGGRPDPLSPDDLELIDRLIDRCRRELQDRARRLAEGLYRRKPAKAVHRLGL